MDTGVHDSTSGSWPVAWLGLECLLCCAGCVKQEVVGFQ